MRPRAPPSPKTPTKPADRWSVACCPTRPSMPLTSGLVTTFSPARWKTWDSESATPPPAQPPYCVLTGHRAAGLIYHSVVSGRGPRCLLSVSAAFRCQPEGEQPASPELLFERQG